MEASQLTSKLAQRVIRAYQLVFAGRPRRCRFYPTCSDYAMQTISTKGLYRGVLLTAQRLLKCHPWHPGGYDPIQN